jgi:HPt (histidine-containing phosphotransfer) domain-containing protein
MKMLKKLFEDDLLVERYIKVLKTEIPKMIQSIHQSIIANDFETVSILAHGLKSQLAYIEDDVSLALAAEMELIADSQDVNKREKLENAAIQLELLLKQILVNL